MPSLIKKVFLITLLLSVNNLKAIESDVPIEEIEMFTTVLELIKKYYVSDVDDKQLFKNAIHGTLAELDPHSAYFEKQDFNSLHEETQGEFGGVGIKFVIEEGVAKVISPIEDSPAEKAGIKALDQIIKVDNYLVKGLTHEEVSKMIRGEPETLVKFTIVREGQKDPRVISVNRDIIKSPSIKLLDLEDILYIRIPVFQEDTGRELIQALQKRQRLGKNQAGIILDLRNNPGGVVNAAVQLCDIFLDKDKIELDKKIVFTKGKVDTLQVTEHAKTADLTNNTPLVVLINQGSASASEIVAGALQDHKRAIILGERSFGKGSVQVVIPLKDENGIKLTIALYYTPAGRLIQATGIEPDVQVLRTKAPKPVKPKIDLRENNLPGHLSNQDIKKEENKAEKEKYKKNNSEEELINYLTKEDFQIKQAINLLVALKISSKN